MDISLKSFLAQEIFAHACCYYGASVVKGLGVDSDTVDELYNRGNPIDIEDGGDTLARQAVYLLIWELTPTIIAPFSIKEEVVKNIKSVIIVKISGVIMNSTDNILISTF